jgi:HAD superfamily hydrolase (TIGR01490 family)
MNEPVTNKSVVVFDLDRTVTKVDTYLLFLAFLALKRPSRWIPSVSLVPAVIKHKLGYRDNAWLKERFWTVFARGLSDQEVRAAGARFSNIACRHLLRSGAIGVIENHRREDHHLLLASASFDVYVEPMGRLLGFHGVVSTKAEISKSFEVTGKLDGRNCYGAEKVRRVAEYIRSIGASGTSVAYSDHHSDLMLLESADRGVAVFPTKRLRASAVQRKMDIRTSW